MFTLLLSDGILVLWDPNSYLMAQLIPELLCWNLMVIRVPVIHTCI